jgi:hypothetical protein
MVMVNKGKGSGRNVSCPTPKTTPRTDVARSGKTMPRQETKISFSQKAIR